jgi:hypothetical protein
VLLKKERKKPVKTAISRQFYMYLIITAVIAATGFQLHLYGASESDPETIRQTRKLIRIELDSPESFTALRDMHLDLASHNLRKGAHVIVTGDELREIERRGFSYEVLIDDPSKVQIDPEYRNYEETIAYLDTLSQEYPDLTLLEQVGVSQEYEIPIWGLKISDNPDLEEDEPEILYTGVTHAREPLGNEICLGIARTLLEGYGVDPDITRFVDEEEIWIVSIVNTEGFTYMMDNNLSDPWWRKNQRDNNSSGAFEEDFDGVDLNRNYDFNWITGGSEDSTSWVYRGPFAFSESETQAISDFASLVHRFIFSISYHSWGEEVLYPWYWADNPPPDEDIILEVAQEVGSRIQKRIGFGTYDPEPIAGTVGYSTTWLYGVAGSIDLTIETCTEFIPSGTAIDSIVDANIPGALYLLEKALVGPGITGHVTDSETGDPLPASVIVLERYTDIIEPRTCDPTHGRYFRILPPGVFAVLYEMDGYVGHIEQLVVNEDTFTIVDVELTRTVGIDEPAEEVSLPRVTRLHQNYPNPFNPSTIIEYDIAGEEGMSVPVNLSIYSVRGKLVRELFSGTVKAGHHMTIWDGKDGFGSPAVSGIYILKLETPEGGHSLKMVIQK